MKKLKIKFVDFWGGFNSNSNFIIDVLKLKYDVILAEDPDYLFFSCFGSSHLSYKCVKILFIGENLVPDFNLCDYALGFDWLTFGDRYMRLPLYVTWDSFEQISKLDRHIDIERVLNRKFCSIVVSNSSSADPMRERFFKLLSEYKKVDSGGRAWNNIGGPVLNKLEFVGKYKFNIAFENSHVIGYTTEKVMEPMTVNTVPIYWGNSLIGRDFNIKSIVNVHEFPSLEAVCEYIVKLDSFDEEYLKVLNEPWVIDDVIFQWKEQLLAFLSNIVEKPLNEAKYLVEYGALKNYNRSLLVADFFLDKMKVGHLISIYQKLNSMLGTKLGS